MTRHEPEFCLLAMQERLHRDSVVALPRIGRAVHLQSLARTWLWLKLKKGAGRNRTVDKARAPLRGDVPR